MSCVVTIGSLKILKCCGQVPSKNGKSFESVRSIDADCMLADPPETVVKLSANQSGSRGFQSIVESPGNYDLQNFGSEG